MYAWKSMWAIALQECWHFWKESAVVARRGARWKTGMCGEKRRIRMKRRGWKDSWTDRSRETEVRRKAEHGRRPRRLRDRSMEGTTPPPPSFSNVSDFTYHHLTAEPLSISSHTHTHCDSYCLNQWERRTTWKTRARKQLEKDGRMGTRTVFY